jgi:hypothetical protein
MTTTATTVEEIYSQMIKPLPPSERLKLATLILNGIPHNLVIDESDEWTDEDFRDLSRYSMRHALQSFGETEEDIE